MPRGRGRPTKLTPELQEQFCAALRRCWHLSVAADLCGIDRRSVFRWLKAGRRARKGLHRDFWHAVKKALAELSADAVAGIEAAGKGGNWTAFAWLLERKFPDQWSSLVPQIRELTRWVKQQEKEKAKGKGAKPHGPGVPTGNGAATGGPATR